MEAQELLIALHDESAGYEISPNRVPLSVLRAFARDVDEFLRGDSNDVDTSALDVSIEKGSLAIRTSPTAHPVLLNDLRKLASSQEMDGIALKRRAVIERWQKSARGSRRWRVSIAADFLPAAIVISAESDFRADDADQWVRVERYVRGEIEDMGGHTKPNAHIRLPDGKVLLVDAARGMLRDEKANRLYKPAMIRIVAEYNVMTREYRGARLLEFVEHESRLDEKDLDRLTQRGAKAWRDVPDAGAWVDELRGSKE
ncbi:hypothetical protein VLK31_22465 [Variovorax sp. H27-G14]|uniref:hypothetical protein n=1 Tax=Variovorax sp. H27-G14 TaxID=3111914 RepID=UPI0038FD00E6